MKRVKFYGNISMKKFFIHMFLFVKMVNMFLLDKMVFKVKKIIILFFSNSNRNFPTSPRIESIALLIVGVDAADRHHDYI